MFDPMTKKRFVRSKSVYEPGGPSEPSDCLYPVPALAMHSRELDSMYLVRRNPLANFVATYCDSIDIWPDTYSATASGPCLSMIERSRRPVSAIASSTGVGTGSSFRPGRRSADFSRPSSACIISACVAPLVHNLPKLVGCNLSPDTRAITVRPPSVLVSTAMPQPTPQYEHAVRVTVMRPSWADPVPESFRARYLEEN